MLIFVKVLLHGGRIVKEFIELRCIETRIIVAVKDTSFP